MMATAATSDWRLDSEVISEDESGSEVELLWMRKRAIDEGAQTLATADFDVPEEGEASDFGELDVEADSPSRRWKAGRGRSRREVQVVEEILKLIQPAPVGRTVPVVLMLPCVIVMFLVGIMGFEMVQSSNGFRQTGFLHPRFAGLMGMEPKK
ncbi:MAG: hypothetical protein U0744_05715 [Gemmataceae bacterium]